MLLHQVLVDLLGAVARLDPGQHLVVMHRQQKRPTDLHGRGGGNGLDGRPTALRLGGENFGTACPAQLDVATFRVAVDPQLPRDPPLRPPQLDQALKLLSLRHFQVSGQVARSS